VSEPILAADCVPALREALADSFSGAAVAAALGMAGRAALSRNDLLAAERLTRSGSSTETWIRLFLLGLTVSERAAAAALQPLPVSQAIAAGLLASGPDGVSARLDLRPYSEADGPDWWVLSDLGADVRGAPLDSEHVLGIGAAATTLAQATIRRPVDRVADIGTGCGVQALHLSRHAGTVVATDISERALAVAASTAALNGLHFDLRAGSLTQPLHGETFDQIVCNPPFIVGPGFTADSGRYTYRDSGMAGDGLCRELIGSLPQLLTDGGNAQLLANWVITGDQPWQERVAGWLPAAGCDAWIWQREVVEPAEYVFMWLRDAGEQPGSEAWKLRYHRWCDWFSASGVLAVGMGLVNIRRTGSDHGSVLCEDVRQAVQQPIGDEIAGWFDRHRWLQQADVSLLLSSRFVADTDLVRDVRELIGPGGWRPALTQLRQSRGMRWELEADDAVCALVAACNGALPLSVLIPMVVSSVLPSAESTVASVAAADSAPDREDAIAAQLLTVVQDLVQRGLLRLVEA
jgi:hypothetical protein